MLRPEHCSSCVTHPSWQTSCPQQRSYMADQHKVHSPHGHPRGPIYDRSTRDSLSLQEKQKEQFDRAHRAKDLHPLKLKEQVQFFQNKPATGPIKWTTGPVAEILECGRSYMIWGPNGRVYRRNWAHLKPLCHDSTSFQDHPVKEGEKIPKDNSFQNHSSQARSVSFDNKVNYIDNNEMSYMDTWSMMFDGPKTCWAPPASLSLTSSPPRCHSPRSPSYSPPMSPSAPYRLQWQAKSKAQKHLGHHHAHPWCHLWPPTDSSDKPNPKLKRKSSPISDFFPDHLAHFLTIRHSNPH